MLEPSSSSNPGTLAPAAAAAEGSHHIAHATTASGASKLQMLMGKHKGEEQHGPPLTSRYIRVVNTFDVRDWLRCGPGMPGASGHAAADAIAVFLLHAQIVPHIPPTLCNLYQHGGDLLYLQVRCVLRCAA
jgi:hypothetical protein